MRFPVSIKSSLTLAPAGIAAVNIWEFIGGKRLQS
ncbi:MAG: hypothetical protein JWL90_4124 [Chthoniobacteraceae bacterium]|nr:hypothetical protein [Chthoniobacteraceae bacterium]